MSRFVLLAACLALSAGVARAQGTAEQRQACAPDAIRLCSDTIPDVERTRACMQRHEAELSPRCHALVAQASEERATRHVPLERADPYEASDYAYDRPPGRILPSSPYSYSLSDDSARARAIIAHICDDSVIDAHTCWVIDRALRLQESGR